MSTDAIVILKQDHKEIKSLFRQFQKAGENATDTKGKLVGKLTREIQVAAKLGGPNPEFNARLANSNSRFCASLRG